MKSILKAIIISPLGRRREPLRIAHLVYVFITCFGVSFLVNQLYTPIFFFIGNVPTFIILMVYTVFAMVFGTIYIKKRNDTFAKSVKEKKLLWILHYAFWALISITAFVLICFVFYTPPSAYWLE